MPDLKNTSATLDPLVATERKNTPPVKRAKWHLGIRSQSKPHDIMHEVYRAMKTLGYEWKIVNSFHVRSRKKNAVTGKYIKMSLQLYQVDQKSFLLDFKSLNNQDHPDAIRANNILREASQCSATVSSLSSQSSIDENAAMETDDANTARSYHNTMEFFEMCANLITTLAR